MIGKSFERIISYLGVVKEKVEEVVFVLLLNFFVYLNLVG